jgi:phosphoribosylglycinamide formyltransferase 1
MRGWTTEKHGKIRVVLFLSGRAVGLDSLLRRSCRATKSYEITGALITSPDSHAIPLLERWGIPWQCHDIHEFYGRRSAKVKELDLRPEFDRRSLGLISSFQPSVLVLYGYIYILSHVVLKAYPFRIINIHDSDLAVLNNFGKPRYRGLHATRDAILAGETSIRSTVHIATEELDGGPILARSADFPVHHELVNQAREWEALDILKAYTYAHREWMMRHCWGVLIDKTLEMIGQGRLSVREGKILMDGRLTASGAGLRAYTGRERGVFHE